MSHPKLMDGTCREDKRQVLFLGCLGGDSRTDGASVCLVFLGLQLPEVA